MMEESFPLDVKILRKKRTPCPQLAGFFYNILVVVVVIIIVVVVVVKRPVCRR